MYACSRRGQRAHDAVGRHQGAGRIGDDPRSGVRVQAGFAFIDSRRVLRGDCKSWGCRPSVNAPTVALETGPDAANLARSPKDELARKSALVAPGRQCNSRERTFLVGSEGPN